MTMLEQSGFWISVVQIIWINILLSGDNAVVIALACRQLPRKQQYWGMVLGAGAAIVLRIIFTGIVAQLMSLPFVKLVGAILLVWIAVKLVMPNEDHAEDKMKSADNLWRAVQIVAIADIVMSLDNVIAIAAAAKGNFTLIVFGLVISIPLIVAGSAILMRLLERYPILVWAGAGLLGWVAGEIFVTDSTVANMIDHDLLERMETIGGIIGVCLVLILGWTLVRARRAGQQPRKA